MTLTIIFHQLHPFIPQNTLENIASFLLSMLNALRSHYLIFKSSAKMEEARNSFRGCKVALDDHRHEDHSMGRVNSAEKARRDCETDMPSRQYCSGDDDEWPLGMPRKASASVFRLDSNIDMDLHIDNPRTPSDGSLSQLLGDFTDDIQNKEATEAGASNLDEHVFDPIPLNFLRARGAPVDIEGADTSHGRGPSTKSTPKSEKDSFEELDSALCQETDITSWNDPSHLWNFQSDTPGSTLKRTITSTSAAQESSREPKRVRSDYSKEIHPTRPAPTTPLEKFLWFLKHKLPEQESWIAVQEIVKHCEEKRDAGVPKYQHIPGAVFELAVDVLGAEKFQKLFQASQKVDHGILDARESTEVARERGGHRNEDNQVPSLVDTALAYGFHMARVYLLHQSSDSIPVINILRKGIDTVKRMNDAERTQFWKYMLLSKLFDTNTVEQCDHYSDTKSNPHLHKQSCALVALETNTS